MPATGCVHYDLSFGHLFATYKMTAAEFDAWVSEHSWGLVEYECGLMQHDEQRLGFSDPSEVYATEMASDGG